MLVAVAALSSWVAAAGVIFYITPGSVIRCFTESYRYEPLCWYSAEYSSLLAPLWDHQHISGRDLVFAVAVVAMLAVVIVGQRGLARCTRRSRRRVRPVRAVVDYLRRGTGSA